MKSLVRSLAGRVMADSGWMRARLRDTAVVVAYHRVNDESAGDDLTRSPADYEAFARFYRDHFDVVPLGEIVRRLVASEPLGGLLAITHDDGYVDNFEHAAPILSKLGLPATFFVATRFVGSEVVPWWDSEEGKRFGWMSWDQVRALDAAGFEVAAHTRTHADLGLIDADAARDEIAGSKADLERALGHAVEAFAHPLSRAPDVYEKTLDHVREAGFGCAMSCDGGLVSTATDRFAIPRVPISMWYATPRHLAFDLARRVA